MNNISRLYDISIINERIKEARKRKNLTQQKLADTIGVNRLAVHEWEKNENNKIPSVQNLVAVCNTLDCSMDYLLGSIDTSEIEAISKASLYSGISPEIIRYAKEHPNFCECLNFMMHPKNSSTIFNSLTLELLKKSNIDASIKELHGELKEKIISIFDEYISITSPDKISKKSYKEFLKDNLPKEKISLKIDKTDSKIYLRKCVSQIAYQNFFSEKEFNYSTFINYLVEHTFDPLSHRVILEIQTYKLANEFTNLFTKYLNEE